MPSFKRVAVIGAGPSGFAAVKALSDENAFDTIKLFERRDRVGGIWLYDPKPDVFPTSVSRRPKINAPPQQLPAFAEPLGEDIGARTGIYDTLDSNVGAEVMAFTHTPFPKDNSADSVRRYGSNNPTRPYQIIERYIEDGFKEYRHLLSLSTTVENVEKVGEEWVLTLRKANEPLRGEHKDYWWQEKFDAVVVATGHYNVPFIPAIWGIDEAVKALPHKFEHSKSFRSPDDYVGKKVIVVGGSISAADLVGDLAAIVQGPLYLSQRGRNELLDAAFTLPGVVTKPPIRSISANNGGTVEFQDGSTVKNFDKIIFGTGYRLSYPFLNPEPVTAQNRLAGFYQHVFKIGDPSLTVVGQVKAALSFRVYEYQAVAVARFLAGRAKLPSVEEQNDWETKRLAYKGPTNLFHEVKPDFADYFNWLRNFAGAPAEGTKGYELPAWDDGWGPLGLRILSLKDAYWNRLKREAHEGQIRAKL
ncbi:putative dimethylaniline monooxygenase [Mollisia scopiformis]|uniref:Putative dimethylaniline monooxygenase n=1 Tax=Mollisia scopiformis TaxID=149040 RepID=A0A194X049_MOLSC|nr:putative dimethylaniline monooxygenase [Mollisia scopiformis]KUJ13570.1 putative dimethylaniline monooxygenase [Mollisia scopiformis]